jgi:hypothetical protein
MSDEHSKARSTSHNLENTAAQYDWLQIDTSIFFCYIYTICIDGLGRNRGTNVSLHQSFREQNKLLCEAEVGRKILTTNRLSLFVNFINLLQKRIFKLP